MSADRVIEGLVNRIMFYEEQAQEDEAVIERELLQDPDWVPDGEPLDDDHDGQMSETETDQPECMDRDDENSTSVSRFVHHDSNLSNFVESMKNKNTKKMTNSHVKLLNEFLGKKNEQRKISQIPANTLDKYLASFYFSVRQKTGEEYEPSSLQAMACSIQRYLKSNGYPENINTSSKFGHSQEVLNSKMKELKSQGKGNVPNKSEPLSEEEINILYEMGLLGHGEF